MYPRGNCLFVCLHHGWRILRLSELQSLLNALNVLYKVISLALDLYFYKSVIEFGCKERCPLKVNYDKSVQVHIMAESVRSIYL